MWAQNGKGPDGTVLTLSTATEMISVTLLIYTLSTNLVLELADSGEYNEL